MSKCKAGQSGAVKAVAAVLLSSALVACQPADKPAADAAGAFAVPPLVFNHRTLANGLEVYALPDRDTASVAVQVWYKVGSKDDPPGRSGFAHLFEHLMFKSTANMPPETMDRLTEDVGGFNNASTWNDFTNYYEVVPANHLERVLWGEAERMGSLVVDDANFKPEREVVKNELRQNYLGQPYGRLWLYLTQSAFDVHPYGRPGIGSIEQLDAATIEDVRAFHAAYYRPDNAVLVVSGNFDQAELDQWVDKYFAGIKTPERPIPRVAAVEPQRTAPRDLTVYEANVPLPAISISWPAPAANSPDIAAWMMLDAILTRGQSSRLYQALVYDQQLAAEVFSNFEITEHPGSYALAAILSDGKTAEEGLASLRAEIARMRDNDPTAEELEEARNELLVETIEGRETAEGRASDLAQSVVLFGDPNASDQLLAKLQTVTAADVRRVAQTILADERSVTLRYLPEELQNGGPEASIADAPGIQATAIDIPEAEIPVYTLAPETSRTVAPSPGSAVSAKIPAYEERTLPNGLRVVVASRPGLPLLSASLRMGAGDAADPAGKAGLAQMTADLATRGTATRSATDIAQQIERLGASLGAGSSDDASDVSISARSDKATDVLSIMADVVMNPSFADEELERARAETLDSLRVALRQPPAVGSMAMTRILYGAAPYGQVSTLSSIEGLDREAIAGFHRNWWRPDNGVLVITGNVTASEGFRLAEGAFAAWARPNEPLPTLSDPDAAPAGGSTAPSVTVIDIPGIGQASVLIGQRGPERGGADYFPALVANDVLGGGYSARLNAEIRIKRGLSYGVRSSLPARRGAPGVVASAQTGNSDVPTVAGLLAAEMRRLGAEAISEAEMTARKAVLIGSFGRSVETNAGLAGQLSALAQFGLPLEKLATYSADIAAVTAEQAGAAAKRYYEPQAASVVAVGDADRFWTAFRAAYPNARRITIDSVKFDSPSLE